MTQKKNNDWMLPSLYGYEPPDITETDDYKLGKDLIAKLVIRAKKLNYGALARLVKNLHGDGIALRNFDTILADLSAEKVLWVDEFAHPMVIHAGKDYHVETKPMREKGSGMEAQKQAAKSFAYPSMPLEVV